MRATKVWPYRRAQRLTRYMAAHAPRSSSAGDAPDGYSRETIARVLIGRRSVLVKQLPRQIKLARFIAPDLHEWVVDEAIDWLVTENDGGVIRDNSDLEKAFWKVADVRVRRAHEGRYDLVRAGWARVDVGDAEIPDDAETPEDLAIREFERGTLEEFKAVLDDFERSVLAVKYGGPNVLARFQIARAMGIRPFEVRRAERSIERKLREFSAIVAFGALCHVRGELLDATLEGRATADELRMARAHIDNCSACRSYYVRLVRAVTSGRLQREIGQLVPAPAAALARQRRSPWEAIVDWLSRPFGHDAATVSQLGGAGRGLSTLVGAKLVAVCIGGAVAVTGGLYCFSRVGTAHHPSPARISRHAPAPHRAPAAPTPVRTVAAVIHTATPTATPRARQQPRSTRRRTGGEVSRASTTHEQAVAISPPATTSSGAPVDEFGPGPTSAAVRQPAAAPANGGPEFP
jgi:hypothetical protein